MEKSLFLVLILVVVGFGFLGYMVGQSVKSAEIPNTEIPGIKALPDALQEELKVKTLD